MKRIVFNAGVGAGLLCLALSAGAASYSLMGDPAQPSPAERTISLDGDPGWITVNKGETVKFTSHGREFAWDFDGIRSVVDLQQVAPAGTLDHPVKVYVILPSDNG